jgi:hypothetical protein
LKREPPLMICFWHSRRCEIALRTDLKAAKFIAVDFAKANFYENKQLFGQQVEDTFGESTEDIEEAGKCFAFGRYTASVFHLMRAMESAVKVLGIKLDVTVIDKNNIDLEWGKIITNIKTKVETMDRGAIKNDWCEAVSLLYHVKQAWRNSTMRPKDTYTEDEAKAVFDAVRSFMIVLAPLV